MGEDRAAGYSPIDLDLLVVATDTGLLDIVLDRVLASSCTVSFPLPNLSASTSFDLAEGKRANFQRVAEPNIALILHPVLDEKRQALHTPASDVVPRYPSFRSPRRDLRRARNAVAVFDLGFSRNRPQTGWLRRV